MFDIINPPNAFGHPSYASNTMSLLPAQILQPKLPGHIRPLPLSIAPLPLAGDSFDLDKMSGGLNHTL
jgi:hypothetical protein